MWFWKSIFSYLVTTIPSTSQNKCQSCFMLLFLVLRLVSVVNDCTLKPPTYLTRFPKIMVFGIKNRGATYTT